ncbi:glucokinase [Asanoa ferruginea]|uniref:Glucokinase n=1 Tax=Asanoa ferruginea TaxID=53367 RepID=A0A3D9ZP31_9ACTN|nr:ROK family protein [Asanoa ferruginea]REF99126.1 glucokinase [Asanoa ferruginea]GIF51429.1 glucokinase [Asanoa ferruginea]
MTAAQVLGIDFGGTKVALATADEGWSPAVSSTRLRIPTSGSAEEVVRRSLEAAQGMVAAPVAVGVSTFGVVRGERIRLAPNVPGWEGLELPRLMKDAYGDTPVVIDNDVNAAAAAELRWGALRGVDVGIYINLGTGLAAALVVDGRVVRGAHGAAGEIGYLLDPTRDTSFADGHAPLEELVSGSALASQGSALVGRPVAAAELFTMVGDPRVDALIDEALRTLAQAVANLCITLDPARVVIGGGMMGAAERILPRIAALLPRAVPFPPQLAPATFIDDAPLLGALALAVEAVGVR